MDLLCEGDMVVNEPGGNEKSANWKLLLNLQDHYYE